MSGRTPSSILRKRPSQEEQNRRRSLRAKGGRRVSFAPDDELETMHLFKTDKNSPLLQSQDTQPLAELTQNAQPPPAGGDGLFGAAPWGQPAKPAAPGGGGGGGPGPELALLHQQHGQHVPDAYLLQSPGLGSPMSMDLTNDTLGGGGGLAPHAGLGGGRGFSGESDSLTLGQAYAAAAAGGAGPEPAAGGFAPQPQPPGCRDATLNITDNVPGLSTLVEEDEELYGEGSATPSTTAGAAAASPRGGGGGDDDGTGMDLTGDAAAAAAAEAATSRPRTRRSSAGGSTPQAAAAPSPAASPASGRRSSRRTSKQGAAAQPDAAAAAPRTRGRRSSGAAAAAAAAAQPQDEAEHGAALLSPRGGAAGSRRSSAGAAATPEGSKGPAGSAGSRHHPAPSLEPTPSPLRRITRSMTSPLASPVLGAGLPGGAFGGDAAGAGAAAAGAAGLGGARLDSSGGSSALDSLGLTEGLAEAGAGGRGRRTTMHRLAEQQSKWGFVPGEEDTMAIDMDLPGAGGLGDATLHHVYSEHAGTGELTLAMRQGQQPGGAAAAVAGPGARGHGGRASLGGGRPSVGRRPRASLMAEVIPEEAAAAAATATPPAAAPVGPGGQAGAGAVTPAAPSPAAALGDEGADDTADVTGMSADMDISLSMPLAFARGPAAAAGHGPPRPAPVAASPGDSDAAADGNAAPTGGADGDGLTTNLLLEDRRQLGGWSHVPLGADAARSSLGGGLTGRGSVGSNVLTLHPQRAGHNTTQLLVDASPRDGHSGLLAVPHAAAADQAHAEVPAAAAAAAAGQPGLEDCTTKLLADSTSASACGFVGLLPQPRAGPLATTIAGGAPVAEAAAPQAAEAARGPFGAPAPPAFGAAAARGGGAASAAASPPAPAAREPSPVEHWQQWGGQQHAHEQPPAQEGSPVAGGDGSEPTLELAAGVTQGSLAMQGQEGGGLEDATLEDFALPPDLTGQGDGSGGGGGGEAGGQHERPITMPFSGALRALAPGGTPSGAPGSVLRTPGGSVAGRAPAPISFGDFCQLVDLQFLTHIRRGTSISVCDFAPSSIPQDLGQALRLLAVTSCEVAVLEAAMHELQSEMHARRREAYELEDRLAADNPRVFALVQTCRTTQLEQTKHCLVLLRKACRSQTACSWKRLRCRMERDLAARLAQQQSDLQEQLAFAQAKLTKAQQQREYACAFHADVLKRLAAEEAQRQEAAATRSRLASLRHRLAELRRLNADRQARARALQERVQAAEARRGELAAEAAALRARSDELSAVLAATPQPAHSARATCELASARERLELLLGLQGWRPSLEDQGTWLLSFKGRAGIQLSLPDAADAAGLATGTLVVLPGATAAGGAPAQRLLQALVRVLQASCGFAVPPAQLRGAFAEAEARLGRALELVDACSGLFASQALAHQLCDASVVAAGAGADSQGIGGAALALTLVVPERCAKASVALRLAPLLALAQTGAAARLEAAATLQVADPAAGRASADALEGELQRALDAASDAGGDVAGMLQAACGAALAVLQPRAAAAAE